MMLAMQDLIDHCHKILAHKEEESHGYFATKKEKKKALSNPITKALKNYGEDFSISSDSENQEDIMVTYTRFKAAILRGHKNDTWLKSGNVNIHSGAIDPDDKRRIALSNIYMAACRIRDKQREDLKGLPVEAFSECEELLYPSYLQLYMYRVFVSALDGEKYGDDITKLQSVINELEKELKISPSKINEVISSASEGLFGLASDLAAKMGINIPKDFSFDQDSITKMAGTFMQKPETQNLLKEFGDTLKDVKGIEDAVPKLTSKFNDPSTKEKMGKLLGGFIPQPESEATEGGELLIED